MHKKIGLIHLRLPGYASEVVKMIMYCTKPNVCFIAILWSDFFGLFYNMQLRLRVAYCIRS
ncbi:hypothetical protein P879_00868 [Paragonimus westermani]|uniref:Uncharacterized protein n=1 Tax=Paragonimus westermani TaxID=34504 RepID=A0A8T0DSK6_9TREM|nr:hypothetical protein P879_00868 [Paragonimus westermani]